MRPLRTRTQRRPKHQTRHRPDLLEETRLIYVCLKCGKSIRDKPSESRKYCSRSCYYQSLHQAKEANYGWKGNSAKVDTGNDRARRWFQKDPCSVCGGNGEIHHKDGNPLNNAAENIAHLCRKHHMIADGRLHALVHPSSKRLRRMADAVKRSYTPELRALRARQAAERWRERPLGWHKVGQPVQRS